GSGPDRVSDFDDSRRRGFGRGDSNAGPHTSRKDQRRPLPHRKGSHHRRRPGVNRQGLALVETALAMAAGSAVALAGAAVLWSLWVRVQCAHQAFEAAWKVRGGSAAPDLRFRWTRDG